MGKCDQLGLLLWKNYVVRKRRPGMLALVFLWPVVVFLILYTVRDNTEPERNPTCQFPARLMPGEDLLPFLQSFICSLGNPCEPFEKYEELPSYKTAKLGPLVRQLEPMLKNDTILNVAKGLPNSFKFLKSMAEILTRPGIKEIFDRGIRLGDLFNNHEGIRQFFSREIPEMNTTVVNYFLNASIKVQYLVKAFGSSNIDGIICTPSTLKQFLILPNDDQLEEVSKVLCAMNSTQMPEMLQRVTSSLDFGGLLDMVNLVMAKFREYDIFVDLKNTAESILSLKTMELYIPKILQLKKWLPEEILLFKNTTFEEIDLRFIERSINILDPIFHDDRSYPIIRKALLNLNSVLRLIKEFHVPNNESSMPGTISEMIANLVDNIKGTFDSSESEKIGEIIDTTYEILRDVVRIGKAVLDKRQDGLEISTEVIDGLTNFFPKKFLNNLSYLVALTDNVVLAVHHVAKLHYEIERRVFDVLRNHTSLVRFVLKEGPDIYKSLIESFSHLDIVEDFLKVNDKAGEIVCNRQMFHRIFPPGKTALADEDVYARVCNEDGRQLITEIYNSFDLDNFQLIVKNTLATFVHMVLGRAAPLATANLTSIIHNTRQLIDYFEIRKSLDDPNWGELTMDQEWIDAFTTLRSRGRLDLLGIHLSVAKKEGSISLSYGTIKPALMTMNSLAIRLLNKLRSEPIDWINEAREDIPQLIDSFYLTLADRSKVLQILEVENFTETICDDARTRLLNFPTGSNEIRLKNAVCHISRLAEIELKFDPNTPEAIKEQGRFNWTSFNEKVIDVYSYIDLTIHQTYPMYNFTESGIYKDRFVASWTKELSTRDAIEISVGLLCKIFYIVELPFFGLQTPHAIETLLYQWPRVTEQIFDELQKRVRIVRGENGITELALPSMPETGVLEEVILRNYHDLFADLEDMLSAQITKVFSLREHWDELNRPGCQKTAIISDVLGLRSGTRKIAEEVERLICYPEAFYQEWQDLIPRIPKEETAKSYNWTRGFGKFRRIVNDLSTLSGGSVELSVNDAKLSFDDVKSIFSSMKQLLDTNFKDIDAWRNILAHIDTKLNDLIDTSVSSRTTEEIWTYLNAQSSAHEYLGLCKYIFHGTHEISTVILNILNNAPNLDVLAMFGFGQNSPIVIFYNNLAGIVATLVNGLSSTVFAEKVTQYLAHGVSPLSCADIASWFEDARLGISAEDYRTLKNAMCDGDPKHFNELVDFILREDAIRRSPVKNYPLYATRTFLKFYELNVAAEKIKQTPLTITYPFSKEYATNFAENFTRLLKDHQTQRVLKSSPTAEWELWLEGTTEMLKHLAGSLRKLEKGDKLKSLQLWHLVEDGDVRQLLRFADDNPVEMITLAATLTWINSTTSKVISVDDYHAKMCQHYFDLDYWKTNQTRVRFIRELCSFDRSQLLKSITSDEFYNRLQHPNSHAQLYTESSIAEALHEVIEAARNLSFVNPGLKFQSRIFSVKNLKSMDNDSWSMIYRAEESWLRYFYDQEKFDADQYEQPRFSDYIDLLIRHDGVHGFDIIVQQLSIFVNFVSGGDVWQKIRGLYDEKPEMRIVLTLMEDLPNFFITVLDSFLNADVTAASAGALFNYEIEPCSVTEYLRVPKFIRREGFLGSFSNLCKQVEHTDLGNILPFEEFIYYRNESVEYSKRGNETIVMNHLKRLQSVVVDTLTEGTKDFRMPMYWTAFLAGTFRDFIAQFESMDRRTIFDLVNKRISESARSLVKHQDGKCSACIEFTRRLRVINSQLSKHEAYTELICSFGKLNLTRISHILYDTMRWQDTVDQINELQPYSSAKLPTLDDLVMEVDTTLRSIEDITLHFIDLEDNHSTICPDDSFDGSHFVTPKTYVNIFMTLLDILKRNLLIVDTAQTHEKLIELGKLSEEHVAIWVPLLDVVKKSAYDKIRESFPGATINVNMLSQNVTSNLTALHHLLASKGSDKFLRYSQTDASSVPNDVSLELFKSLDSAILSNRMPTWRENATQNLTWLKNMLEHFTVLLDQVGSLLNAATSVDFNGDRSITPKLMDAILDLLREETIDKFFNSFDDILDDVDPFIENPIIKNDMHLALRTFESMELFKNLGLLNTKYAIKEMFLNWNDVHLYLTDVVGLPKTVTAALSEGKVNMLSVLTKEREALSIKDTICSPGKFSEILEFESGRKVDDLSSVLCHLTGEQVQDIIVALIKNLNFEYLLKNLMSTNVKSILSNANLNEAEGKEIFENLGEAAKLVPLLKDAVGDVSEAARADFLSSDDKDTAKKADFQELLSKANEMMCGKALVQDTGGIYKVISGIRDNEQNFDEKELASLPAGFCQDTYKQISQMNGGKIIWTYVKPLLRGRILYTPETPVIDEVMREANVTFVHLENLKTFIDSFEKSIVSLASLTDLGDNLNDLQRILSSDIMAIAVKSLSTANIGLGNDGSLGGFDISKVAWRMKESGNFIELVGMLNRIMDCLLTDRMIGFPSEKELEEEAGRLIETNDYLAGVVFEDSSHPTRMKRAHDHTLPDNITYKIRMDIDSVPSTARLKNQFWTPGPDGSFIENLRYFRGFVQLQDSIDRALIKIKTGTEQKWKTLTQQMPYPCWTFLSFQSSLYESQGLQVCFFFALMMCVGAAVRHIVWERESQNAMVMSVMGLKPWRNTLAWFITSLIELVVVAISIHIILTAGKILPHSDPILLLLLLLDYVFASVAFCYMVSTMFSSASLAAVTTVVMFLLTYMPYIIVIAMEAHMGLFWKLVICLNMSTSFCYGCLYAVRREVQGTGLTWATVWEDSSLDDSMSLGLVLLLIAFDGFLYTLIGYIVTWYTNTGRGFHGLRSASLWWADDAEKKTLYGQQSFIDFENQVYFTNDVQSSANTHEEDTSETSALSVNKEKETGVRFENVTKTFKTERGECLAVDDFSLQLREGEITTLLGRNGAGKTTIIKMLTGMIVPTSGDIHLSLGDTEGLNIGVCPQNNVLVGCLTPREHMRFYAKLKCAKSNREIDADIETMLSSVELNGQEDELVCRLSGGTQRRLCVSLAFLSSPKLVILDEPGAGVDPAARRQIWRLIDKHRPGKTILMSTHHLEEADMLSDTVVIMHNGKILCSGSPLALKMTHGQGYKMTVTFPLKENRDNKQTEKRAALTSIVKNIVPNSTFSDGNEQEFNIALPFQNENGITNDFAGVFKALETNQQTLGFSHFTTECDTLERVFLDMCSRVDYGHAYKKPQNLGSLASVNTIGYASSTDAVELIGRDGLTKPSAISQCKTLLKKRFWHFTRDWRSLLSAFILPTMFVAVAMGFSLIRPPSDDQRPLPLTTDLYDAYPLHFYSMDRNPDQFLRRVSLQLHDHFGDHDAGAWQTSANDTGTCNCINDEQICQGLPPLVRGLVETVPGRPTLDWITSTHQQYIEKRYGGWSLSRVGPPDDDDVFVVWYNNKGHHALPAYVNALNAAILRANGVSGQLTTINHPIKLSKDQLNRTSLLQHVADVGVALVLLVAFSLVGAQGARELVRERLSEEKRILYLAGVGPITYWTAALIWDLLVFGCSILLAVIVFEIFSLPAYVARDNLISACVLLFLYAWAIIPFTHLAEKIFDDASLSNMVLFCLNTFIGVSTLATILIIDVLGKTKAAEDTRNVLHNIFLLLPQYALGDGLIQLSKNDIAASLLRRFRMDTYKHPLSSEVFGSHCIYLIVVGTIFYVVNLIIESVYMPDYFAIRTDYPEMDGREDEDVLRERRRVEDDFCQDVVRVVKLRKEYRSSQGKNIAVRNLSLGVRAGECFGLFGVNGAGKSTTFKILTTEVRRTAGRVFVNGNELGSGPLCCGNFGYCPQTDALDPFLTPRQSLSIHAEICGMTNVSKVVNASLEKFDLTRYADQRIDSLSGGNKRKLCTAVSVSAPSRIVLMDEATSGMDPAAKDLVARAVRTIIQNQGSVLMTSHSVAECENLCSRVGVLAKAGLRCIGTPQHLKHKYGEAYVVFLRFANPVSIQELQSAVNRHLPGGCVASVQAMAARLLVPRRDRDPLSVIFTKVKDLATELKAMDYSLTQSSLDQVLVNLSEESGMDGFGDNYDNAGTNVSSLYSSTDGIRMSTMSGDRFTALPMS